MIKTQGSRAGSMSVGRKALLMAAAGVVGLLASSVVLWKVFAAEKRDGGAHTADEEKLMARAESAKARNAQDARRLRQQDVGSGLRFDAQGNMVAEPEGDLPQNKVLDEAARGEAGSSAAKRIARQFQEMPGEADDDEAEDPTPPRQRSGGGRGRAWRGDEVDDVDPAEDTKRSMLGYSTVPGVAWAARRPDDGSVGARGGGERKARGSKTDEILERMADTLAEGPEDAPSSGAPRASAGAVQPASMWTGGGPAYQAGPSGSGAALYAQGEAPAERRAQQVRPGGIGDMTIGAGAGPDQTVRQGKFLDCAVVNEIRADLVESPVIAMVTRDFVSLDGQWVLVPSGSKLLGEAGRVQNLQQSRVYIKFDRILYPDQRSAYFPVRKETAVDAGGAVGIEGDVDRHFALQFGAAIMLGVLDGLAAQVQTPAAVSSPAARDLVLARTSQNLSNVVAGVINRYANVVPTVSVNPGAKLKVFFSEDVRMTPYMSAADLSWVRARR